MLTKFMFTKDAIPVWIIIAMSLLAISLAVYSCYQYEINRRNLIQSLDPNPEFKIKIFYKTIKANKWIQDNSEQYTLYETEYTNPSFGSSALKVVLKRRD